MKPDLILGTRGSKLSLIQAGVVRTELEAAHPGIQIQTIIIRTRGDLDRVTPLEAMGEPGVFTGALQDALLGNRNEGSPSIDAAVHSCKDLPTMMPAGTVIGAVPAREDPRDALVSPGHAGLLSIPAGGVIGTSSARREAVVRRLRPDLQTRSIRGNVDSRVRQVDEAKFDGTILAVAGLKRLGLEARIREVIEIHDLVPAAGQGALAVQVREGDERVRQLVNAINDAAAWIEVCCEREVVRTVGAGCMAGIGVLARVSGDALSCVGQITSRNGHDRAEAEANGPAKAWQALAGKVAERLLAGGGARIIGV